MASQHPHITATEREVLRELVQGKSNVEIANSLHKSEQTIKTHLKNISQKIGREGRVSLTLFAIQTEIVPCPVESCPKKINSSQISNKPV